MIVSVIVFILIRVDNPALRLGLRILLIPVIAGISYEFIRLAGRSENPIVGFLSAPGLALQRLTTKEPDDDMIEVAIKSVEAVFDWRAFLGENFDYEEYRKAPAEEEVKAVEETVEDAVALGDAEVAAEETVEDKADVVAAIEVEKVAEMATESAEESKEE